MGAQISDQNAPSAATKQLFQITRGYRCVQSFFCMSLSYPQFKTSGNWVFFCRLKPCRWVWILLNSVRCLHKLSRHLNGSTIRDDPASHMRIILYPHAKGYSHADKGASAIRWYVSLDILYSPRLLRSPPYVSSDFQYLSKVVNTFSSICCFVFWHDSISRPEKLAGIL